jgi:hypothetical protein
MQGVAIRGTGAFRGGLADQIEHHADERESQRHDGAKGEPHRPTSILGLIEFPPVQDKRDDDGHVDQRNDDGGPERR